MPAECRSHGAEVLRMEEPTTLRMPASTAED
jgi:hypothetical protein